MGATPQDESIAWPAAKPLGFGLPGMESMMPGGNRPPLDEDQQDADRQTASLAGLALALALVVVGLWLIHILHHRALVEDCLMSGRRNCDHLVVPSPWS